MDTAIKVQHAKYFKIDPSTLNVGAIMLPETIITTIVIGEEVISKKVPLNEAFSAAEQEEIKKHLEPLVIKAHQTATQVAEGPVVANLVTTQPNTQPTTPAVPMPVVEEEGDSLF